MRVQLEIVEVREPNACFQNGFIPSKFANPLSILKPRINHWPETS